MAKKTIKKHEFTDEQLKLMDTLRAEVTVVKKMPTYYYKDPLVKKKKELALARIKKYGLPDGRPFIPLKRCAKKKTK